MSELKPIDIWEDATNAVCQIMQESKMCKCPDGECLASTIEPSKETLAHWNTRAAPEVTELVRYEPDYFVDFRTITTAYMNSNAGGRYVRYDQAAEIIAELKRRNREIELEHTGVRNSYYDERRKVVALEAKLAKYEAQEPFGYVYTTPQYDAGGVTRFIKHKPASGNEGWYTNLTTVYALPAPAPAADLKAENQRLKSENDKLVGEINDLQETVTALENKYT